MNKSGIHPKGYRILVLPDEIKTTTASGIITTTAGQELREELAQVDGIVVEMGPSCFPNEPAPWCKVGDRVIFGKYAGLIREGKDKKKYRIINDDNIVATVDEVNHE